MIGQRVLVTGGTGVVGRPLVRALLAMGKEVVILSRKLPKSENGEANAACTHLQGDVAQPQLGLSAEQYRDLAASITTIFHLAARTDFKGATVAEYQGINIDGVRHVHALAAAAGAHLHHVSTAFVRGRYDGLFHEEELDCGQGFRNGYEESKFRGEQLLRQQLALGNTPPVTIYRPAIILERHPSQASANTFGPFIFLDAVFRIILAAHRHDQTPETVRVRGSINGSLPFIFDDNVVEALLAIAQSPDIHGRTFHLVSSEPCPNRMLEEVFNTAFGRQAAHLSTAEDFAAMPPTPAEKILARKTTIYDAYMDLDLHFDRRTLEAILGHDWRPTVSAEELLRAFSGYLAGKKEEDKAVVLPTQQVQRIDAYFDSFLPAFVGRQLIAGLASLSCRFWLEVAQCTSRSLEIQQGRLIDIVPGHTGSFGYRVQPATFLQVVAGLLPPQQGFFQGDINLEGNTMEALRTATALEEFFHTYPYAAPTAA